MAPSRARSGARIAGITANGKTIRNMGSGSRSMLIMINMKVGGKIISDMAKVMFLNLNGKLLSFKI